MLINCERCCAWVKQITQDTSLANSSARNERIRSIQWVDHDVQGRLHVHLHNNENPKIKIRGCSTEHTPRMITIHAFYLQCSWLSWMKDTEDGAFFSEMTLKYFYHVGQRQKNLPKLAPFGLFYSTWIHWQLWR